MRKISKIAITSLIIISPLTLSSQEIVSGLRGNVVAEKYYSEANHFKKRNAAPDTIELPFIDDFSDSEVEPKPSLWSDKYAFINKTYPFNPPSVGVATLDALNFDGSHYPEAGSSPYQADYLTSQPINLNYLPDDNIYLSFYFQPGGLAEPPEKGDSLILEFLSVEDLTWKKRWSAAGIDTSGAFTGVILKIEEAEFLKKGFRFRFRNYASQLANTNRSDMRANADHWHIDYIRLDKNRSASDTILRDVAFVEPVKSLLKDYSSLPWPHFQDAFNTQRAPFIGVVIQNHDSISRNIGTLLEIRNLMEDSPVYRTSPLKNDISSGDSIYYKYAYNYLFNSNREDSGEFEIKTIIQTDLFDYKPNDTLNHIQKFYDYYALDDGTAEASYGLRGSGTKDASSALKYNSFTGDSLRAVDIYFAQIVDSINLNYYFYLNVWLDSNGKPGEKIVDQIGMQPEYSDKLNKFVRYTLETPVFIKGTFYIGFTQTVEYLLNIGLDLNVSNKSRIFNNLDNGIWNTTEIIPGTPMMHPVFRQNALVLSNSLNASSNIVAYPNPADDYIKVSLIHENQSSRISRIELLDISGRLIKTYNPNQEDCLFTGDLVNGMYFLRMNDPATGKDSTKKIIINH
jgi:hypothetical protein